MITEPGIYDLPLEEYLADPVPAGSLSSSGARKLLPPSCPARFRYEKDHPPTPTRPLDLGHAAHQMTLGAGPGLIVVEADDWRTKAARTARDDAHDQGAVPLLAAEHEQLQAMAAALRGNVYARALLNPGSGSAEQSLFWQDADAPVWRRARLDWLPFPTEGRYIIPEYKTCRCADPDVLARAIHSYGYHQQGAWYLDAATAVLNVADPALVFIFQEKDPPYLVTVAELDAVALRIGRQLNRDAIDLYIRCRDTDHWPAYAEDIAHISLPAWVENQYAQEFA